MEVYDRWGNQVFLVDEAFAANDQGMGWDGTFRGQAQKEGVYIYNVVVNFIDGESQQFSGEINLIK